MPKVPKASDGDGVDGGENPMTDKLFDMPELDTEHISLTPGVTLLRIKGGDIVIEFQNVVQVDGNLRWQGKVVSGTYKGQTFSAPKDRWERA